MMKHGLLMPALLCWAATAVFAVQGSPGGPRALDLTEMEAVEGGDLFFGVDRYRQMMTVTQVTPGQYYGSQSYTVKVTTSVVQNKEVTTQLQKGDMTNAERQVATSVTNKSGERLYQLPVQYPSGTFSVFSPTITLPNVQGPVIRTSATQYVPLVNTGGTLVGTFSDYGYYIHYANPAVTTNTLGCIGVQSLDNMVRVADTLKTDTATYPTGTPPKQTVTVTDYPFGFLPTAAAFTPAGASPASSTPSSPSSTTSYSSPTTAPAAVTPAPVAVAPAPAVQAPVVQAPTVSAPVVSVPVSKTPITKTAKLKEL